MKKIFNAWNQLGDSTKLWIIAIPIALILFTAVCIDTDWDEFSTTENDYVALETVAHEIIETQNLVQQLGGNLKNYTISFENDGTIEIVLYGNAESLQLRLTDNFEVKSMYRGISTVIPITLLFALMCVATGFIGAMFIYDVTEGVKKIYIYIKR